MAGLNDFVVFNDFAQRAFTEEMDQLVKLLSYRSSEDGWNRLNSILLGRLR